MTKLNAPDTSLQLSTADPPPLRTAGVHPHDVIYSGLFGNGQVVELLKNADGYAYGHRIRFENGMEAELLITNLPTRH